MRPSGGQILRAAAALLLTVACAAAAQTLPKPLDKTDQALKNAEKALEQATKRADTAQQHIEAAAEQGARATKAEEQGARAADHGNRAADHADRASDTGRTERAEAAERAARADRAERAEAGEHGNRADAADRADRGHRGQGAEHRAHAKQAKRKGDRRGQDRDGDGDGTQVAPAVARGLAEAQAQRLQTLVRAHPIDLEMTRGGPAVRAQIVAIDVTPAALRAVRTAGFTVVADETIEGLGLRTVTLRTPRGMGVDTALDVLRRLAPRAQFAANHLHLQAGAAPAVRNPSAVPLAQAHVAAPALGIIDGGIARHADIRAPIEQRGFARGAPAPNEHGTAVASLAAGEGRLRAAFPGAPLLVADIYGLDPAGGNALALVRALGWMVSRHVRVVAVPIAGPSNPVVARAVSIARQRGTFIIAPVGNAGPAAPPSYPASYGPAIAVTGVDRRNRILIEAGRAPRIDYAAPAADIVAATSAGGLARVRGTSFAVPLVAGRLSRAARASSQPLAALDQEAVDLGRPGPDPVYGRGLVCGDCRPRR